MEHRASCLELGRKAARSMKAPPWVHNILEVIYNTLLFGVLFTERKSPQNLQSKLGVRMILQKGCPYRTKLVRTPQKNIFRFIP